MKTKKIISLILSFSILLSCMANLSFASDNSELYPLRSNEEWAKLKDNKIEFEEIDALVHEYNNTVRNNWNKYQYGKTNTEISDTYFDAADKYFSAANTGVDSQDAMAEAQAYGFQTLGENNLDDSQTNYLTYTKAEKEKALAVKNLYVNYFINYVNYEIAKANFEEGKKAYESGKRSFDAGAITKLDLMALEKNVYSLESAVIAAKTTYETTFKNLLVETGYSTSAQVDLDLPKEVSWDDIQAINVQDDIQKAKDSNFQIKIWKRKLENANTTELQNENKNNIASGLNYVEYDVNNKYQLVVNQYNVVNAKLKAYNAKESDFQKCRKEYFEGKRSYRQLEKDLLSLNLALYDYIQAKYTLKLNFESYKAAVNGLAATS